MKRIKGLKYALDKRESDKNRSLLTCAPDFKNLERFSRNEDIEAKFNEIERKKFKIKNLKETALKEMCLFKQYLLKQEGSTFLE